MEHVATSSLRSDIGRQIDAALAEFDKRAKNLDQVEVSQIAVSSQIQARETEIAAREKTVKNREDSIGGISKIAADRLAEIKSLKDRIESHVGKVNEANQKTATAEAEQRRIEGVLRKALNTIAELREEVAGLKQQIAANPYTVVAETPAPAAVQATAEVAF